MFNFRKQVEQAHEVAVKERIGARPEPMPEGHLFNNWQRPANSPKSQREKAMEPASIEEYRRVAESVGVDPRDIFVEEFRALLIKLDLPVFNLPTVVRYMDNLVRVDNPAGLGWHWCPVRPKDTAHTMQWGRASVDHHSNGKTPGSDYYESLQLRRQDAGFRVGLYDTEKPGPSAAYTRTLPLHALKKIAQIEKEWTGDIAFLVTDYTTTPHIQVNPDPFLMAVIPNSGVAHGKGRFVIDVWDEPGFGIEQMLK